MRDKKNINGKDIAKVLANIYINPVKNCKECWRFNRCLSNLNLKKSIDKERCKSNRLAEIEGYKIKE